MFTQTRILITHIITEKMTEKRLTAAKKREPDGSLKSYQIVCGFLFLSLTEFTSHEISKPSHSPAYKTRLKIRITELFFALSALWLRPETLLIQTNPDNVCKKVGTGMPCCDII